jgi:hypothetical protein
VVLSFRLQNSESEVDFQTKEASLNRVALLRTKRLESLDVDLSQRVLNVAREIQIRRSDLTTMSCHPSLSFLIKPQTGPQVPGT